MAGDPEHLLIKTVDYNHAGRFASLFCENTGLTPEEYRKMLKK